MRIAAAFIAIVAFFVLTAPNNRTESDDRFHLAERVETRPVTESLVNSRLMLYHVVTRAAYVGLRGLGLDVSGLDVLESISVASAALSVMLLYFFLAGPLGLGRLPAALGAAMLALSYGFWRYSSEADVYPAAALSILAVITVVARGEGRADANDDRRLALAGALAGLSVLFYRGSVIALFLALPLALLHARSARRPVIYGVVGAATMLVGYLVGFVAYGPESISSSEFMAFLTSRVDEFEPSPPSAKTLFLGMSVVGHGFVSSNWIFGFDALSDAVAALVPHLAIDEEVFAAREAGWIVYVPLVLSPLVFGLLAVTLRAAASVVDREALDRWTAFLIAWVAVKYMVIAVLNAGLEAGVLIQIPLAALAARFLFEPCVRLGGRASAGAIALVAALFLVNVTGGMGVVRSADGDLYRVLGAPLLETATPDDLVIVTRKTRNLGSYLRYEGAIPVHATRDGGVDSAIEETLGNGGRVFVFEDFFEAPDWLARYAGAEHDEAVGRARSRARSILFAETEAGAVYEMR